MTKQPIALIHTACKNCIFANYDSNTQISCKSGYLDKYRKNGVEVLEVYDNDKNFYVLNNKKCLSYREQTWLDKQNKDADLYEIVRQENLLKYVVLMPIQKTSTLDQIKTAFDSILNQEILPSGILIYQNRLEQNKINNADLLEYLQSIDKNILWRIKNFIDKDMSDSDRLRASIASCMINRFYLLVDLETSIPDGMISNIQKFIDNGNSFGCIDINNNKFFSYISVQFCKNIKHIDLLSDTSLHIKYETIS